MEVNSLVPLIVFGAKAEYRAANHVRQSDAWEEDMPMELIDDVKAGSTAGADAADICHEGHAVQFQLHSNALSTAEFFVFALAEVCFQLRQSGLRLKALKGHDVTFETVLRQPVQPVRDPLQHYTGFTMFHDVSRCFTLTCMALHGIAWHCMALHGIAWHCMALHGHMHQSLLCFCAFPCIQFLKFAVGSSDLAEGGKPFPSAFKAHSIAISGIVSIVL